MNSSGLQVYQYMELYDCKLLVQMCSSDIAVSTQIVRLASTLSGLLISLCIYLSADMSCSVYNQQAACTLEILDQYSDVIPHAYMRVTFLKRRLL